ncbi:unnamed protein product, partial [Ectocarpus sp. 12 AP-2014]
MMADGSLLMPPPPPPTFRAPTRDSINVGAGRSSTMDEQDLSFMDSEIKRLHRDMANMLAWETPLADENGNNSQLSWSSPGASEAEAAEPAGARGAGVVIARRTNLTGDSDFDLSDDDDAIALLKDDLRTTTERFFDRLPRQQQRAGRRASAIVPTGASPGGDSIHRNSGSSTVGGVGVLRQQQSWSVLTELEKGVGG